MGFMSGGAPSDQTAYMLDGIPVFNPYHAAGLFSAWNPDALSQLSLDGASPSPDYPAALSGTVAASTRSPGPRLETRGSMTTTQARLTVDGPLGTTGIGFLLSVRSGLPTLVAPSDPTYLGATTHDWLAKLQMPVLGGGLRVLGYENENAIDVAASANHVGHWSQSFSLEKPLLRGRMAADILPGQPEVAGLERGGHGRLGVERQNRAG